MIAGAYPVASNALSLGDIESNSNLNQPLRAQIELLSANPQETQQLRVRLAPTSVFSRVGIDRPAFLDNLRFTSTVQNGKPVILVSSNQPISEPFVNFLLEVSWPQGQLLKEYTVMLDPPVLMQPGSTTVAGSEAAVRAEPQPSGVVNRPTPQAQQATQAQIAAQQAQQRAQQQAQQQARQQALAQQRQQQQAQQQAQARQQQQQARQQAQARQQQQQARQQAQARQQQQAGSRTYRVKSGDTLYKVANRMHAPGVNADQMMWALYRANPEAFINGNINGLKAGAVLQAPAPSAAERVSRAEARRQVRQQYAEWKKFRANLARNTTPQSDSGAETRSSNNNSSSTPSRQANAADDANTDNARLEVLGKQESNNQGNGSAGGSSERLAELEKELSLARESLATRQRETQELKSRVSELESLLSKKDRLIALRDDQLADLQQKLAQASNGTVKPSSSNTTNEQVADPMQQNNADMDGNMDARPEGSDIQNYVGNVSDGSEVVRAQAEQTSSPTTTESQVEPPVTETQVTQTEPEPAEEQHPVFADEQAGSSDFMSLLGSPLIWKVALGALTALLGLGLLLFFLGRRKAARDQHDDFDPEFNAPEFDLDGNEPVAVTKSADAFNTAYGDLEEQLDKAEMMQDDEVGFDDSFGLASDPTQSSPSPVAPAATGLDDDAEGDEVLEEANVYIAYGLHQQAESELKKALEKHPERLEYRHKLLENYFAANNRDEFDQNAAQFLETPKASRQSSLWKDIANWGSKISPDNPLYRAGNETSNEASSGLGAGLAVAGAAAATGLGAAATNAFGNEDDGDNSFESDLNQYDLGGSDEDDFTGLDLPHNNTSADDFGLDDLPDLPDSTAQSLDGEMSNAFDDSAEGDDFDFELNEIERQLSSQEDELNAFDDKPSFDNDGFEVAETVDDDLDFNFDDLVGESSGLNLDGEQDWSAEDELNDLAANLDNGTAQTAQHTDTAAMSDQPSDDLLDDAIDFNFDEELDAISTGAEESLDFATDADTRSSDAEETEADDLLDFDLDDESTTMDFSDESDKSAADSGSKAGAVAATAGTAAAAVGTAAAAAKDNVTNLNLHLDQNSGLKKILPQDNTYADASGTQETPAKGQANANQKEAETEDEDSWLGDIDDALSFLDMPDDELDLHEAHISTKLDLARAYLDMGDVEGARSTLEEVMVEGNDNQRREAETLLHQTG